MGLQFRSDPPSPTDYTGNVYYFFFKDWLRQPFGNNYISSRIFQRVETDLNPSPKPYSAFLGTCGIRCARIPHLHRKVPPASNRLWSSPPPARYIYYKKSSSPVRQRGRTRGSALRVFHKTYTLPSSDPFGLCQSGDPFGDGQCYPSDSLRSVSASRRLTPQIKINLSRPTI